MSKEEKMLILEMVSQGKITPEQGVELLKAVGYSKGPAAFESVDKAAGKKAEKAIVTPEEAAARAEKRAEEVAGSVKKRFNEIERDVDSIGQTAGNIGKLISQMFGGSFLAGGPAFEFTDEIQGDLPKDGEIEVILRTSNGRIVVESWDRPGYSLTVKKRGNAGSEDEARKILEDSYDFKQNGLTLDGRAKDGIGSGLRNISVAFYLKVPESRKTSVNLDTANGRIVVERVSGDSCIADTANGRIIMTECNFNDSKLNTANGRIEYQGTAGRLVAGSANGRINTCLSGTGDWQFNTANGRIEVEIRKEQGSAYEVDLSSNVGTVTVEGIDDAEVIVDEARRYTGGRRYMARSRGFESAEAKGYVKASASVGKIGVRFVSKGELE